MRRRGHVVRALSGVGAAAFGASFLGAVEIDANWPQWRGPGGQGISAEVGLPLRWSATENVRWKTKLPGRGHSSPIVWESRIFLTTAVEGEPVAGAGAVKHYIDGKEFVHPDGVGADRRQTLKVLAVDRASGRFLWERTAWEGTPYDTRHRRGSFASPTPVTDGRLVYAYFGSEGLYAYDFEGNLAWKTSLGGIATMGVGVGTSPVLYHDLLILQCDEDNGERSFLVALDKRTGKQAWRVPRKVQVSWATPIVVRASSGGGAAVPGASSGAAKAPAPAPTGGRADERDELVTSGTEAVVAYDPLSGRELWRSKGLESNAVPSPVAGAGVVVLSAGFPTKLAMAIRPGGSGDISDSPRVLWKHAKGTGYVPSPLLYRDHVYLMTDKGLVTCLDARTGEVRYEGGRPPVPATFMASPVAFEGRILLFSEDGDTFVLKAGPVHEVLRTNPLGEPIYATPAVSGGQIFIRALEHLYAIGRPGPS